MQLAVRKSFFLVIIFQVSKRMKSPTKKETLFASVFFTAKAYTLRTEGREKEELKKEGGVGGACVCVGGWSLS